jgi:hypothetical protein
MAASGRRYFRSRPELDAAAVKELRGRGIKPFWEEQFKKQFVSIHLF